MFTQDSWDSLRREKAFNGLAALLEPEQVVEDSKARSWRLTDRVVVDMVHGRAYHKGREIDGKAWKRGRLVAAKGR